MLYNPHVGMRLNTARPLIVCGKPAPHTTIKQLSKSFKYCQLCCLFGYMAYSIITSSLKFNCDVEVKKTKHIDLHT